jgi:hypothetical protein
MEDKYQTMMTRFLAETQPDMFIQSRNSRILGDGSYQAVVSPLKRQGFQNYIDRLREQDEQKMRDLAVERSAIGEGMLRSNNINLRPEQKETQTMAVPPSEKPGWIMAEGTNFWSVNEKDPYWQTKQGHDEAVALYGFKPGWVSNPVEQENQFVDLQPTKRISL